MVANDIFNFNPQRQDGDLASSNGIAHLQLTVTDMARSRADVDGIYQTALGLSARIVRAPPEGAWALGCFSVLFEDPDGIRIDANFVHSRRL